MALNILNWQVSKNTCVKANLTLGAEVDGGYSEFLTARVGVEHKATPREASAACKAKLFGLIPYTVPSMPAITQAQTLFYGARVGAINNTLENIVGLDVGVFGTRAETVTGLQLGGFLAIASKVAGIQAASVYNEAKEEITGLQLGFINWVRERWGLIGGLHIPQMNFLLGLYFGQE